MGAAGDREFCVKGRLMEAEDKLNLRLRIGQHDGAALTYSPLNSACF